MAQPDKPTLDGKPEMKQLRDSYRADTALARAIKADHPDWGVLDGVITKSQACDDALTAWLNG